MPGLGSAVSPEDLRAAETRLRDGLAHLQRRARIPTAPSPDALGDPRAQAAAQRFLTRLAAMTRRTITIQTQIADRLHLTATAYQSREDAIAGRFRNLPTTSPPTPHPANTPHPAPQGPAATPITAPAPGAAQRSPLGRITPPPPSAAQTNHLAPTIQRQHDQHAAAAGIPNEVGYVPGQIRDVLQHTQDRFIGPRLSTTPASTPAAGGAGAAEGS